jgi:hypothetical protein
MKILKTDKRLIDEGHRYKIEGDLISATFIDLADLDKDIYVTGYIKAEGYIKAGGSIEAGWSIEAEGYIKAGGYIEAGEYIKAEGYIKAGEYIEAGWSIEAGGYIKARWYIKAGASIEAGDSFGISAGLGITAKDTISFGLYAYAGICTWKKISDEEKTISCSKLLSGEVAYGILKETGVVERKKVTLELTNEQIESLKSQGLL